MPATELLMDGVREAVRCKEAPHLFKILPLNSLDVEKLSHTRRMGRKHRREQLFYAPEH